MSEQSIGARLHQAIGDLAWNMGETLQMWAIHWLGIDDMLRQTPEEEALSTARARYTVQRLLERERHPCPGCVGKGWIRVPDDPRQSPTGEAWEPCPVCRTSGVDPAWDREGR